MINLRTNICLLVLGFSSVSSVAQEKKPPNFVYIMADELGYYEPGFMGGTNIQTPNLDRMAYEGMQFSQLLAGSSVCAPTRCTLMTGKHSGHSSVRKNDGGTPLRANEITLATLLKTKGYATGGFGKWGCGGRDSTGVPEQHGFDLFLGYYDQVHAHTYYPPYLIRNSEEVTLSSNQGMSQGEEYSQYIIHDAAKKFIREHSGSPFFAYLPYTPPHGLFDIPENDPAWDLYKDQPWPDQAKKYAAMVTMLDAQVGEILQLLKELEIEDNTLVIFSGDNGGADYFSSKDHPRGFHGANVHPTSGIEFRGKKGNLYEGGLRIPFIAHWPGVISPSQKSDHLGYFPDILPTFAELSGIEVPEDIDGISFAATLLGESEIGHPQVQHDYLYWELGNWSAIRQNQWRAVRPSPSAEWELYDLSNDPSESRNLNNTHSKKLSELITLAESAHEPAIEGTFHSRERHERDRRAKFGKQDDLNWSPRSGRKQATTRKMPTEGMLANNDWRIIQKSSENADNGKIAANALDRNPNTWWHSRFTGGKANPPHSITIDLGQSCTLNGVAYMARQDASRNGAVKDFSLEVSEDGETFVTAIKSAFELSVEPQVKKFSAVKCRFVRIVCTSDYSGDNFASISELGFLGK